MLGRRAIRTATSAVGLSALSTQRRFDHERWYGHALELDIHNYKYTGQIPKWMRPDPKSPEEMGTLKSTLPHIDFAGSYELLSMDASRLNVALNRKEFANEIKHRLEKQANTVARAQQLVKSQQYKPHEEETMIARIADEEHVQCEMKTVKCMRANEVAEDNRLDILPGGSPSSLREKARWNTNMELHPIDRMEIGNRLTAWLPEKYHILYYDDWQTVAANDKNSRQELLTIIANVEKELAAEAKASGFEADLKEVVEELYEDIDPTRKITKAAIQASTNLDELEQWSRMVHEYNGDDRIFDIYERAAELRKDEGHKALVKTLRELTGRKQVKHLNA